MGKKARRRAAAAQGVAYSQMSHVMSCTIPRRSASIVVEEKLAPSFSCSNFFLAPNKRREDPNLYLAEDVTSDTMKDAKSDNDETENSEHQGGGVIEDEGRRPSPKKTAAAAATEMGAMKDDVVTDVRMGVQKIHDTAGLPLTTPHHQQTIMQDDDDGPINLYDEVTAAMVSATCAYGLADLRTLIRQGKLSKKKDSTVKISTIDSTDATTGAKKNQAGQEDSDDKDDDDDIMNAILNPPFDRSQGIKLLRDNLDLLTSEKV